MEKAKRRRLVVIWVMVLIVAIAATSGIALAITSNMPSKDNPTSPNNDDLINYIKVNSNEKGGQGYKYELGTIDGRVETDTDYIYKFGYYFNSENGSSGDSSSVGWVEQPTVTGWGCVVRSTSRNKTELAAPAGVIQGYPVTYFNYTFTNCKNLKHIPNLPATAENTDRTFYNCSSLTDVDVRSISIIGKNMFGNCTKLERVYIPAAVTTIKGKLTSESPFLGANSNCEVFCEIGGAPGTFETNWNYCAGAENNKISVKYSYDYYIWRLNYKT